MIHFDVYKFKFLKQNQMEWGLFDLEKQGIWQSFQMSHKDGGPLVILFLKEHMHT